MMVRSKTGKEFDPVFHDPKFRTFLLLIRPAPRCHSSKNVLLLWGTIMTFAYDQIQIHRAVNTEMAGRRETETLSSNWKRSPILYTMAMRLRRNEPRTAELRKPELLSAPCLVPKN
jgi:hypothetical protein